MKKIVLYIGIIVGVGISGTSYSQTVIPEESALDATAALKVMSPGSDKGVMFPTLTTIQMYSIIEPATGLLIFNTDENQYMFYNGTAWSPISKTKETGTNTTTNISEGELRFYTVDNSLMYLDGIGSWLKIETSTNTITP
ncbi:MAG: hypothetical protein ACOCWB_05505 [Bacteroidota bacterium]